MNLSVGNRSFSLRSVNALIFDLDGTLVETEHMWAAVKSHVAARRHRAPKDEELSAFVGRSLSVFARDFIGARDQIAIDQILREMTELAALKLPEMIRPLPGAESLIRCASDLGLRIAVCSSSPQWAIRTGLEALGVDGIVECSISAAEMDQGKPDKRPYVETLSALGIDPHQAIAFEDSISGITSSTAAGIGTIALGDHLIPALPPGVLATCTSLHDVQLDASCNE